MLRHFLSALQKLMGMLVEPGYVAVPVWRPWRDF